MQDTLKGCIKANCKIKMIYCIHFRFFFPILLHSVNTKATKKTKTDSYDCLPQKQFSFFFVFSLIAKI